MKWIKLALISATILFLIATGMGLLFPSVVVVSRAIDIDAPRTNIWPQVNNLYNWRTWVEGMQPDKATIVNAKLANLRHTQIKTLSDTGYILQSEWYNSKEGWKQNSALQLIEQNNKTVVHWQFEQHLKWYPWERFASMLNDKILGTMMERNLQHLKQLVEKPTDVQP